MLRKIFNPFTLIFCATLFACLPLQSAEMRAKSIHFGPGPGGGVTTRPTIHFGPGPGGNTQTITLHPLALMVMRSNH